MAFCPLVAAAALGGPADAGEAPLQPAAPLLDSRKMHGAAVLGNFLYVVGGLTGTGGYAKSVEVAPILPDGQIGAWRSTTPLPQPRCYISNSTLALNDVLYVAGGYNNASTGAENSKGFNANTVLWSTPLPDGTLGAWAESPPFPGEGLDCLTAVTTQGHLHIVGGLTRDKTPSAYVYSGIVDSSGGVVSWDISPPLPHGLWFHNAVALGGRVWVWGGLTTPKSASVSSKVYSAPILSGGQLGMWVEDASTLPVGFYSAAGASAGSYLFSFCPRLAGAKTTRDVWFTHLDGSALGEWRRLTTALPVSQYIPAAPDYRRGTLYIPGGWISPAESSKQVCFFRLSGAAAATSTPTPSAPDVDVAATTPHAFTFQAALGLPSDAVPGFVPYRVARSMAIGPPSRSLLLYFTDSRARLCQEQRQALLSSPDWTALSQRAVFAWIPIQEYPQLAAQLGVVKIPTWIPYDPVGGESGRVVGVLSVDQLQRIVTPGP